MPRNLDPNPSCANNLTGRMSTVTGTPTRVTGLGGAWVRPTASRATTSGAYATLNGAQYNAGTDLGGRTFSVVVQCSYGTVPASDAGPFVQCFDSAGTYTANLAAVTPAITAGGVMTTVLVGTAPAGTTRLAAAMYAGNTPSGLVMTLGAIRIDEVNDPALAYADGGSGNGWAWDGTAGSSTSTQTVPDGGSFFPMLMMGELATPPGFHPDLYDDFTNAPDGALAGRQTQTGQTWFTFVGGGQPASDTLAVSGGTLGPPPGHIPGYGGSAKAGYAEPDTPLVATVGWIGATFRWDASASVESTLVLLAAPTQGLASSTSGGSHLHLGISPVNIKYAVWDNGINNFTDLVPVGGSGVYHPLPVPMSTDGTTVYRADIWIDRTRNTAYVNITGNPTVVYVDSRIGSVDARWPIWEYYTVPNGTNLPRFIRVWADRHRG